MNYFLIFSYEILKLQKKNLNFPGWFGLTRVNKYNPGPGSLTESTSGSGLITMVSTISIFVVNNLSMIAASIHDEIKLHYKYKISCNKE
jgi:hypothetical protein